MEFNTSSAFVNLGEDNIEIAATFIFHSFTLNLF